MLGVAFYYAHHLPLYNLHANGHVFLGIRRKVMERDRRMVMYRKWRVVFRSDSIMAPVPFNKIPEDTS